MNKVYWSITGFSILVILFSFGYYISFENARENNQENKTYQEQLQNNKSDEELSQAVDANKNDTVKTTPNTAYVEESYDIADAIYQDRQMDMPKEYIGLTRLELLNKLQEFMKEPPKAEVDQGLVSVTLNTFSETLVKIRKVYDNKDHYAYFLTEKGGYVVVYTNDKKTLVDQTGILISDLTKEEQKELENGVYLDDLDQLYGLLESYTS